MNKYILYALLCFTTIGTLRAQDKTPIAISQIPYLQALTDSSVSILWTTNQDAIAWVEIAPDDGSSFYQQERPKFYDSNYGFNRIGKLHRVDLKDLAPGTKYRYRVYAKQVLSHEGAFVQYGRTVASSVYQKPLIFRTSSAKDTLHFFVVNDIHGNNKLLRDLIGNYNLSKIDFAVLNGDMVDHLLSEKQMFEGFMQTTIELLAGKIPFYYSRGNHETRGPFAFSYPDFFPTPNGKLYYTFQYGEAFFIVLDSGEDKPDSDIEYSGLADMDNYRTEQAVWLEQVVNSGAYKRAKYKIAICHMPPMGETADWHGAIDVERKFVPILNRAGIQIMLSGHLHRHIIKKADAKRNFPILVNSNINSVLGTIDNDKAIFKVIDQQGKEVDRVVIPKLR